MKNLLGAITVLLVAAGGLFAATQSRAEPLQAGAAAPDFTTPGALAGKVFTFNLADKLKQGPVVLYFFPKVFTKGCTAEAHEFAEKTEEFNKMGASVIGLSGDKIDEIAKFSVDGCRNKFTVGRASPEIIKAYGVAFGPLAATSNRTSFVIGADGKIKMRYSDLDYSGHVTKSLEAVKALAKAQ
jgi:thioredoxin-dependent peroxiredoxin